MFLARHKCQTDVVRATLERSASKLCYRNLLSYLPQIDIADLFYSTVVKFNEEEKEERGMDSSSSPSIDLTNPENLEILIKSSYETLELHHLQSLLHSLSPTSPLLLLHLRLLRNLCFIPAFQSSFIQYNGPDFIHQILTSNPPLQILKVELQVLGNVALGGNLHVQTIWTHFFPDGFSGFAMVGVVDQLCMVLDTCCSGNGGRMRLGELCEDGKGLGIVLEIVKITSAEGYKEEWLEWLLAKICIEESYFSLLFVELGSLGVSITSNGPESHYTVFTYEQAFLCRILSKCMSQQSNEVTVSKEFALQILNILKEACSIVDFTLRESSELPTGFPSIDILGYSIVMLRDICAWEGVPLYANESPIQSLLSAGIAEYFLNLLRELEPPAIIKKCTAKANIPKVKEKMADKVCPYKGYRRDLVSVIASCAYRRNHVQNEIREREGVYLILQQCVLDEDNPYLREWGMLAMSYLMWDNAEIVRELKELQLQAPVQTPEIAALGLEVVIDEETGRAKLVNTPSYTKDWEG